MPLVPSDFGIKISQPNYDIKTAADYQLLFNSAWPSLQIAYETTILVTAGSTVSVPHGLGFPPLVFTWIQTKNETLTDYYPASFTSDTNSTIGRGYPSVDATNVYVFGYFDVDCIVAVKVYNVDLSTDKDYGVSSTAGSKVLYSPDFGIKLSREGKNANSTDLRDFIIHSRAQSPALLAVKTEKSGQNVTDPSLPVVSYTNVNQYTPWMFGYAKQPTNGVDQYFWAPSISSPGVVAINALNILGSIGSISYDASHGYTGATIVVLRDPLFVPDVIAVNYNG